MHTQISAFTCKLAQEVNNNYWKHFGGKEYIHVELLSFDT